jgi:hypothetical protein
LVYCNCTKTCKRMKKQYCLSIIVLLCSVQAWAGTGGSHQDTYLYLILIGLLAMVWGVAWLIDKLVQKLSNKQDDTGIPSHRSPELQRAEPDAD